MSEPVLTEHKIDICEPCYNLEGDACNTPGCVFIRRTTKEISEYLDMLLIRPKVDGVQLDFRKEE